MQSENELLARVRRIVGHPELCIGVDHVDPYEEMFPAVYWPVRWLKEHEDTVKTAAAEAAREGCATHVPTIKTDPTEAWLVCCCGWQSGEGQTWLEQWSNHIRALNVTGALDRALDQVRLEEVSTWQATIGTGFDEAPEALFHRAPLLQAMGERIAELRAKLESASDKYPDKFGAG